MITMRALQKLTFALPRCRIKPSDFPGRQDIVDRDGTPVGDIHWASGVISIYEHYEYCDEVLKSLAAQGEKVTDATTRYEEVA